MKTKTPRDDFVRRGMLVHWLVGFIVTYALLVIGWVTSSDFPAMFSSFAVIATMVLSLVWGLRRGFVVTDGRLHWGLWLGPLPVRVSSEALADLKGTRVTVELSRYERAPFTRTKQWVQFEGSFDPVRMPDERAHAMVKALTRQYKIPRLEPCQTDLDAWLRPLVACVDGKCLRLRGFTRLGFELKLLSGIVAALYLGAMLVMPQVAGGLTQMASLFAALVFVLWAWPRWGAQLDPNSAEIRGWYIWRGLRWRQPLRGRPTGILLLEDPRGGNDGSGGNRVTMYRRLQLVVGSERQNLGRWSSHPSGPIFQADAIAQWLGVPVSIERKQESIRARVIYWCIAGTIVAAIAISRKLGW